MPWEIKHADLNEGSERESNEGTNFHVLTRYFYDLRSFSKKVRENLLVLNPHYSFITKFVGFADVKPYNVTNT